MANDRFRQIFTAPHAFLTVIHAVDLDQVTRNLSIAIENGAHGAFLINHEMSAVKLLTIHQLVVEEFRFWTGLNILDKTPQEALELVLPRAKLKGLWSDNVGISDDGQTIEARRFSRLQADLRWNGLYFGGTAFKYQGQVTDLKLTTQLASLYADVVTTSGEKTGEPPSVEKIREMKETLTLQGATVEGATPYLAIASGMSPENVHEYMPYADCFLVSTRISKSFTELDPKRVRAFADALKQTP